MVAARTSPRLKSKARLLRHPHIHEVAIVGVPHERWGEAPHAFVPEAGASATEDELRQFARTNSHTSERRAGDVHARVAADGKGKFKLRLT
jgi:acyl-CoA synthetase (AMP-forming)/AMP-acid ligase II